MATSEIADHGALEQLKALGAWIIALLGALGAWWAWRTSILRTMSERIAELEKRVDHMAVADAAAQMRIAELTGEAIGLRDALKRAEVRAAEWRAKYYSRRERHERDAGRAGHDSAGLETASDADADDDSAAAEATSRVEVSGELLIKVAE